MVEKQYIVGEACAATMTFQPQPVTAVEAFERGGRNRLRMLVVCVAPLGPGMPLNLRREWALLRRHVEESRVPVTLFRLLPPTPEAFARALRQCAERGVTPHIVHFAGHGQPRYLSFEDELGREARYQREDLASALGDCFIPVVMLNACHTATRQTVSLARYLVEEGAAEVVVGHREPVADSAAVNFAGEFYRRLHRGDLAIDAFTRAQALLKKTNHDAAMAAELFGNISLQLTLQAQLETSGPRIFDGTYGCGRMPEVPAFFGREKEIVKLAGLLANESIRGAAIVGVGGIGKTTIALELANRHAWRFPGGTAFASVRSILSGGASAEELVRNAAAALMVLAAGGAMPVERLLGHLQQQPGLLVFDNLEDLPEQELERLLRVTEQLPLNGSKVLLTLRTSPQLLHEWPWLQVIPLASGLADGAGAAYVVQQGREKEITILQTTKDQSGVYQGLPLHLTKALSGHPKMLDVAVGIAARGLSELRNAVPELDAAKGDLEAAETISAAAMDERMDALYSSSVDLLDEHGRRMLSLLPSFPDGSFTPDELLTAALATYVESDDGRVDEDLEREITERIRRGLESCRRAGLVDLEAENLLRCHSTVQEYVHRRIDCDPEAMSRIFSGLMSAALAYIAANHLDYRSIDRRLGHLLGLLEAGWALVEQGQEELSDDIAQAAVTLGYYFLQNGRWSTMDRWLGRIACIDGRSPGLRRHRLYLHSLLLSSQGKLEEARSAIEESMKIDEQLGDSSGTAASLHQLATIELHQARYARSRDLLRRSIRLKEELGDRQSLAVSLRLLAIIEERCGKYDKARALLREADRIKEESRDPRSQAAMLNHLAIIDLCQGKYGKARKRLVQSLQVTQEAEDPQIRAASLHQLAISSEGQGDYIEARAFLRESIHICTEIGDLRGQAASLHQLAIIRYRQGDYPEARAHLQESIGIKEKIKDTQGRAASLHLLAIIVFQEGDCAEARRLLQESTQVFVEIGDRRGQAASLHQLAIIESTQGRLDEARRLHLETMQIDKEIGDQQGLATSLHQLAIIEESQGNLDEARTLLHRSLHIKEKSGDQRGRAVSLHQLAIVEEAQGRYDEARRLLRESIRICEELGEKQGLAMSLHQLGMIEFNQGRNDEACKRFYESKDVTEEIRDTGGQAASLIMIGQIEAHYDFQSGIDTIREGVEMLRQLGSGDLAQAEAILASIETERADTAIGTTGIVELLTQAQEAVAAGRPVEAEASAREALLQARRAGSRDSEAAAVLMLSYVMLLTGREEAVIPLLEQSRPILTDLGLTEQAETVPMLLEKLQTLLGRVGTESEDGLP